eukprot:3240899-Pyramimonas_sp.AAC.1
MASSRTPRGMSARGMSAQSPGGMSARGQIFKEKTVYTDEECFGEGVPNTQARYRQRTRMLTFIKETVGAEAVRVVYKHG